MCAWFALGTGEICPTTDEYAFGIGQLCSNTNDTSLATVVDVRFPMICFWHPHIRYTSLYRRYAIVTIYVRLPIMPHWYYSYMFTYICHHWYMPVYWSAIYVRYAYYRNGHTSTIGTGNMWPTAVNKPLASALYVQLLMICPVYRSCMSIFRCYIWHRRNTGMLDGWK